MKVNFFTNILNGNATNLLAVDPTGQPLQFDFKSKTFDFEVGNVQTFGQRNVVSYGGNFRHNIFDLTIAPQGDNRNGRRRVRAGRALPRQVLPCDRSARAWTSSTSSRTRSSRRGRA